jgi:hypothetical protein
MYTRWRDLSSDLSVLQAGVEKILLQYSIPKDNLEIFLSLIFSCIQDGAICTTGLPSEGATYLLWETTIRPFIGDDLR